MIHGSPTGCRRAGQDFCGEGLVCLILSGTSEWRTEMFSTQKKAGIPKFASQILWSSCFFVYRLAADQCAASTTSIGCWLLCSYGIISFVPTDM